MKVLLTGATGFIGGHVLSALLEAGAEVRCLIRQSSPARNLEGKPVDTTVGDLRDFDSIRRACEQVEAVYHCAADYRLYSPDPRELYESNVEGTRNVMRAATEASIGRVIYTSSVGALGLMPDGSAADETAPVSLDDMVGHYKRSKFLAERVAEQWARKGLAVVIVNPSAPVGEGDLKPTATGKMILDFLKGKVPAFVDTGLNLIDVRDVALGHVLAAEKGKIGSKYILGNQNLTLQEIYQLLAEITGRPSPKVKLPHWVPLAYAAFDTGLSRLRGKTPQVPLEAVRLARYKMFFDSGKAVEELGLPQTPVGQPLRRAVEWYQDNGYLEREGK